MHRTIHQGVLPDQSIQTPHGPSGESEDQKEVVHVHAHNSRCESVCGPGQNPGLLSHRAGADEPAASTEGQQGRTGAVGSKSGVAGPKTGKLRSSRAPGWAP